MEKRSEDLSEVIMRLKRIEAHLSMVSKREDIRQLAAFEHPKVFPKYRNCHKGKEIVLLATGPTLDAYELKLDAIHIGVNRVFYAAKADLDYLFIQDRIPDAQTDARNYRRGKCKKFYGVHYMMARSISWAEGEKAGAERYYFMDNAQADSAWYCPPNLSYLPLATFSSVVHPAVQFALWTGAKRIYLVGCDSTLSGYSTNIGLADPSRNHLCAESVVKGWQLIMDYAERFYPDTEIISINPVGLKGIFRDVYTPNYLAAHPEIVDAEVFDGNKKLKRHCRKSR